jgi:hypothetical protein
VLGSYDYKSPADVVATTRTYTDRHGNTSTMNTAGIGRRPDPAPDYPLREDPRQVDIVDAVAAYDRAVGDLRVRVRELVQQLAAGELRISASAPGGGDPAVWVVTR